MKNILLVVLLILSATARGEWVVGAGYLNLSDDDSGIDVSIGALGASFGYRFDVGETVGVMPRLRVGFGVGDDTVDFFGPVDVEIEHFLSLGVRGVYQTAENLYLYLEPSYANLELEVSAFGMSASEDDWELGAEAGIGFHFMPNLSAEIAVGRFDETTSWSLGVQYFFR